MGIKIKHGDPKAQLAAAAEIGERKKQEAAQLRQEQINFQTMLRQQDQMLELEKYERSKRWEIDKMELASRLDFEREEKVRQRKLDEFDNIDKQLDKEVQAGRLSEKEVEVYRLKNDLARGGMNVSISELTRQRDKKEQFGIPPYWMKGKGAPEGSPERQLYKAQLKSIVEGRTGTRPWFLDPEYISTSMGKQAQEVAGIFLTDEEIQEAVGEKAQEGDLQGQLMSEFQKAAQTGQRALAKKLWDEGVRLGYWSD